ncbi:MAG: pectin esterase [Duncaniella sp.]|nr:pectin esterase [Duncaniella sp.]
MRNKALTLMAILLGVLLAPAGLAAADYKTDIYVNRNGKADYRTITEAIEGIRAYMDYTATVHIAPGTYCEKIVIPSWLTNVVFEGEDAEKTVITNNDHAKIMDMGTFRTYTVRIDGSNITLRNLTIENNAPRMGQAVSLHTEGDCLKFENCRLLGNQDTIFTGGLRTRLYFSQCYIEGTTDYIFGPATAYFKDCQLHCKSNSYITAASTPKDVNVGYVFDGCKITAAEGVDRVFLGRPWRPYAFTMWINCEMGSFIAAPGWNNWRNPENEKTARYGQYGCTGPGADTTGRVSWARNLDKASAAEYTDLAKVFTLTSTWNPLAGN